MVAFIFFCEIYVLSFMFGKIFLNREHISIQGHLFFGLGVSFVYLLVCFWWNHLLHSLLEISFLLSMALSRLGFSLNSLGFFSDISRFLVILLLNFLLLFFGFYLSTILLIWFAPDEWSHLQIINVPITYKNNFSSMYFLPRYLSYVSKLSILLVGMYLL